jgi:Predicted endonuclease containing a URI domain
MKPFYVYIMHCADKSYYVGHADNIESRISAHKMGSLHCYTNTRLPITVVFVQEFATRGEAIEMERRVKGWNRKKKEALINEDWNELIRLSNYKNL